MTDLERIARDPLSRRQFLARMSAAGLGAAAVALLAGCGGGGGGGFGGSNNSGSVADALAGIPTKLNNGTALTSDQRVLVYALALETTEADIYRQALNLATQGVAQTALLRANPGAYPIGGRIAATGAGIASSTLGDLAYLYLAQYAFVEAAHRDFILVALGLTADNPAQPTTANATNPVVNAAGYKFPAATDLTSILTPILIAEETGVTAYLGAAPLLSSTATGLAYAQIATAIYSTEARHSAGVRYVFGYDIGPGNPTASGTVPTGPFVNGSSQPAADVAANEFEYALDPQSVLRAVKAAFYN